MSLELISFLDGVNRDHQFHKDFYESVSNGVPAEDAILFLTGEKMEINMNINLKNIKRFIKIIDRVNERIKNIVGDDLESEVQIREYLFEHPITGSLFPEMDHYDVLRTTMNGAIDFVNYTYDKKLKSELPPVCLGF